MVKYYLILLVLLGSCKIRYAELSIQRRDYDTLPFRTDGYYYNFNSNSSGQKFVNVYCYYKNGLQLHWGNQPVMDFTQLEKGILDKYQRESIGLSRSRWAVFEINGDTLVLETWAHTLASKKGTFRMYKKIINDTTLYSIGLDRYYYFRKFSPKPDSTYSPIK